jgi:hypothetical protein
MKEYFLQSLHTALDFGGNGLLLLYFAVALIYLLVREKDKGIRKLLGGFPLAMVCIFFIPLVPFVIGSVLGEEETFYRFLWLIPMTLISAYATILFLEHVKFKWLKALLGVIAMVCVAIGGNPGYQAPVTYPAENIYQVPQQLVELCDYMVVPGREVKAVFPHELVPFVRQYTSFVVMPYGYETMVERWMFTNDLAEEMIKDTSDAGELARLAREDRCHYIVLNKGHQVAGTLEDYDYNPVFETKDYVIYLDKFADVSEW